MKDGMIVLIVAAILAAAVWYIRKEKKRGNPCIGCPDANKCTKRNCGCGLDREEE